MIDQVEENNRVSSSKLLIFMGILWLLLATSLLFYQFSSPTKIEVKWDTATEVETIGFYLHRSQHPDGELFLLNEGDGIIPGQGDPVSGATYTYVDENVLPGETYCYTLEEVEFDLSTNLYTDDVSCYSVSRVTWWAIVLTAISFLAGPILLIMGIKENRSL